MVTESDIRNNWPAFADMAAFPPAQFTFYLNFAKKRVNETRWADLYDEGITFFVLHYLVLHARTMDQLDAGGPATIGKIVGAESAKSVEKASASYDVASVSFADAGHWNQTTYGVQFYQLSQLVGMGGIQL